MRSKTENVVALSALDPARRQLATGTSAHFDPKVAQFFTEMRRHLGQPRHVIAHRLGTSELVLTALEAGDLVGIPSGDALIRVVGAYTAMLGLDPRPILAHIEEARAGWLVRTVPTTRAYSPQLLSALNEFTTPPAGLPHHGSHGAPAASTHSLPVASVQSAEEEDRIARARLRRRRRLVRTLGLGVLTALATIALGVVIQNSAAVHDAIGQLPKHLAQPARATYEAVRALVAPGGEHAAGRSTPAADQHRRTDKLPTDAK